MGLEYGLAWLPMVALAIGNAAFREGVLTKRLSELRAHQVSTLTCAILLTLYMAIVFWMAPLDSATSAASVGATWLLLTLAFEFLAGHYVFKNPWPGILHDYNLAAGRVWSLLLLWIFLAPLFFWWLQGSH